MKARDLVFDIYGDYGRYLGGSIRLGTIAEILEPFGFSAPTVRVTMSRMKKEGWFTTQRQGRETEYTMTDKMLRFLDEGYVRIFQPPIRSWDGRWTAVMLQIPDSERVQKDRIRRRLVWEGFGQLNSVCWLSPRASLAVTEELLPRSEHDWIDCMVMEAGSLDKDRDLVARCWDLSEVDSWYRTFIGAWEGLASPDNVNVLSPREALHKRLELITTYRQVLFMDPFLPRILQPEGWLGGRGFQTFVNVHEQLSLPSLSYAADLIENG